MDRFRQSTLSQGPQIEREIYTFAKVNNQVGMCRPGSSRLMGRRFGRDL